MEREPVPVIGTQVSAVTLLFLGLMWVLDKIPNTCNSSYYLSLGAIVIIVGPIISQIIYGIWKSLGGFRLYDITKYLCKDLRLSFEESCKIQSLFDNFWHNNSNINDEIIRYSRSRSVVCQMYLFASRILSIGALIFLVLIFYFSYSHDINIIAIRKSLILFLVSGLISCLFEVNFKITSKELIRNELNNIEEAKNSSNAIKKSAYKKFKSELEEITTPKKLEDILEETKAEL